MSPSFDTAQVPGFLWPFQIDWYFPTAHRGPSSCLVFLFSSVWLFKVGALTKANCQERTVCARSKKKKVVWKFFIRGKTAAFSVTRFYCSLLETVLTGSRSSLWSLQFYLIQTTVHLFLLQTQLPIYTLITICTCSTVYVIWFSHLQNGSFILHYYIKQEGSCSPLSAILCNHSFFSGIPPDCSINLKLLSGRWFPLKLNTLDL